MRPLSNDLRKQFAISHNKGTTCNQESAMSEQESRYEHTKDNFPHRELGEIATERARDDKYGLDILTNEDREIIAGLTAKVSLEIHEHLQQRKDWDSEEAKVLVGTITGDVMPIDDLTETFNKLDILQKVRGIDLREADEKLWMLWRHGDKDERISPLNVQQISDRYRDATGKFVEERLRLRLLNIVNSFATYE